MESPNGTKYLSGQPPLLPASEARSVPVEVLPPARDGRAPEAGLAAGNSAPEPTSPATTISRKRLGLAFGIAVASDILSVIFTMAPPIQWVVDFGTAVMLFLVLGWNWMLLPGLIAEAMPGLSMFPAWVMVVGAIAVYGAVRPKTR